jgi:hypothetical protein
MSSNDIVFDPARRQVLPLSASIRPVRFARRQWEISQQVREICDSWDTGRPVMQPAPRPIVDDANCESIILEGATIQRTWRKTGAFQVRQNSTAAIELVDTTPPPLAFEVVADTTLQTDAAAALAAINDRKPSGRRSVRLPRKPLKAPRTASPVWLAVAFTLGGLAIAALVVVAMR